VSKKKRSTTAPRRFRPRLTDGFVHETRGQLERWPRATRLSMCCKGQSHARRLAAFGIRTADPRTMKPCCLMCKVELPLGIASFGNEACRAKEGRTKRAPGRTAARRHREAITRANRVVADAMAARSRRARTGGRTMEAHQPPMDRESAGPTTGPR
jgi:hypothetical protein